MPLKICLRSKFLPSLAIHKLVFRWMMQPRLSTETLRTTTEKKRAAFVAARAQEQYLFEHRFNGSAETTAKHFKEWREHHEVVSKAFDEWQAAVDAYLAASVR